jgi:mannose-6-phosphate isomerase-like protein (cupin superfamily)
MTALKAAVEKTPATATSSITVTDEYSINILRRGSGASALTHPGWTELHYILDGSATFVTGGTLVPASFPAAGGGAQQVQTIQGGVSRHVSKGDAVVVPAGTPHWYKDVDGSVTYLEVRFMSPHKDDAAKQD